MCCGIINRMYFLACENLETRMGVDNIGLSGGCRCIHVYEKMLKKSVQGQIPGS